MAPKQPKKTGGERRLPNLYGYNPPGNTRTVKYEINSVEAKVIRKIFILVTNERLPLTAIAKKLNTYKSIKPRRSETFSQQFLKKIVTRPQYSGYYRDSEDTLIESDYYPAIITLAQWHNAQRLLGRKIKGKRATYLQRKFPLSGLLNCKPPCNKPFYAKANGHYKPYYVHESPIVKTTCTQLIDTRTADSVVEHAFLDHISSREGIYRSIDLLVWHYIVAPHSPNRPPPTSTYNDKYKYLLDSIDLFAKGIGLFPDKDILSLVNHIDHINNKLTKMSKQFESLLYNYLNHALERWYSKAPYARRDVLQDYFDTIAVGGNRLHISYRRYTEENAISYSLAKTDKSREWEARARSIEDKISDSKDKVKILQDIQKYLLNKAGHALQEKERDFFRQANAILEAAEERAQSKSPSTRQRRLSTGDFFDTEDAYVPLRNLTFSFNAVTRAFSTDQQKIKGNIMPIIRDDWIVAFSYGRRTYFNARFMHQLPEWFYGAKHEYIKTDKGNLMYIVEENRVQPYVLGRTGSMKRITLPDSLAWIRESKRFEFVDIE